MIIELYSQKFEVYGFPVIEGDRKYAYATDQQGRLFILTWAADKEPVKGNVQLVRIDN